MAVSRRMRFEILRRDGHTCRYCGAKAPDVALEVDHVIPVALGGGDTPNNLVTACEDCNRGKSSTPADAPMVEEVDATAELMARAVEVAAERRQMELAVAESFLDEFFVKYKELSGYEPGDNNWDRWSDWENSVERFLAQGLTPADLYHFAKVVGRSYHAKKPWNYFCGMCWNELARRQEDARRLIEDGEV